MGEGVGDGVGVGEGFCAMKHCFSQDRIVSSGTQTCNFVIQSQEG